MTHIKAYRPSSRRSPFARSEVRCQRCDKMISPKDYHWFATERRRAMETPAFCEACSAEMVEAQIARIERECPEGVTR